MDVLDVLAALLFFGLYLVYCLCWFVCLPLGVTGTCRLRFLTINICGQDN